MDTLRKEVHELISLNERTQSSILRGERMTDTEIGIISMCANELLTSAGNAGKTLPNAHDGKSVHTARTDSNRAL